MGRKRKPDPLKYCIHCGKLLLRKRYGVTLEDMGRFLNRNFCSLHCANSRGIRSQSSSRQHVISAAFVKPRCESCGGTQHLHVHHINRNWRDHRKENLRTLCIRCHLGREHRKPPKKCLHCEANSRKHGMCQKHFQRWKKYGDPFLTKQRTPGSRNNFEIVRASS